MRRARSVFPATLILGLLLTSPTWGALTLWLDASDTNTTLDENDRDANDPSFSGSVATWLDKSGSLNNAQVEGLAPSLIAGGAPSGLPLINFPTSDDHYFRLSEKAVAGQTGISIFLVARAAGVHTGGGGVQYGLFDTWLSNQDNGDQFLNNRRDDILKSADPLMAGVGGASFGTANVEARAFSAEVEQGNLHIVTAKLASPSGEILTLINGDPASYRHCSIWVDLPNPPCFNPGAPRMELDTIARYDPILGLGVAAEGELAEIQIYDSFLSTTEEANIGAQLGQKWGIQTEYSTFVPPTVFHWSVDSSGDWNLPANWDGGGLVPDGTEGHNQTAVFGAGITSGRTVFTDQAVTVNQVRFDNTLTYAIVGLGSVNFAATTTMTPVPPGVDVLSGNHQFQAIVNLLDSTTANIASGSTLEFNHRLLLNGQTLTKTGGGTLAISNDVVLAGGTIDIQQGTIAGNGTVGGDVVNDGGTISPGNQNVQANSLVPEPATWLMLGVGLLMTAICGIRKKRSSIGEALYVSFGAP